MKGVLATTFVFMTWLLYNLYLLKRKYILLILSLVFYTASLLTKVNVAIFPIVIFVIHLATKKEKALTNLKSLIVFIILSFLSVAYQIWTYSPGIEHHILWYITHTVSEDGHYFILVSFFILSIVIIWKKNYLSIKTNIRKNHLIAIIGSMLLLPWFFFYKNIYIKIINLIIISFYSLYKIALPLEYSFDYGINQEFITSNTPHVIVTLIALLTCYILYIKRKTPYLILSLSLFIITSLPHLGLVDFSFANISFYSDRYAYLSLIPCLFLMKVIIDQFKIPKMILSGIAIIVILLYSVLSYRNISYWKDNITLLEHSIKHTPIGVATKMALAHHYEQVDDIEKSLKLYHKITMAYPNFSQSYLKRINLLNEVKRYEEAYTYAQLMVAQIKELDPYIFPLIGRSLYMQKKYAASLLYFERSISLGLKNKGIIQHIEDIKERQKMEKRP
jgi:tetratricopeptide (TPR) repeat protein